MGRQGSDWESMLGVAGDTLKMYYGGLASRTKPHHQIIISTFMWKLVGHKTGTGHGRSRAMGGRGGTEGGGSRAPAKLKGFIKTA